MTNIEEIYQLIEIFRKQVLNELKKRFEDLPIHLTDTSMYTVLTALIARHSTLALEFSSAPQIWNGHSAPLFLRPMADVCI